MSESDSKRLQALQRWAASNLGEPQLALTAVSVDASFRAYYRVYTQDKSYIVMDAPPTKEDAGSFVKVAQALHALGLNVPEIHAADLQQGFLLLTDLGDDLYQSVLDESSVERLYGDAMGALITLQACGADATAFPMYSKQLLQAEMQLFFDWYLQRHLSIELNDQQQQVVEQVASRLVDNALEQPQVWVHRDYHSRNLTLHPSHNPGILDFQDAVIGPVTYDLVSLLRDCYIQWPRARVEQWVMGYYDLSVQSGIVDPVIEKQQFLRWFDWMGLQRHMKAIGIFARLNYRDQKPKYLNDVPRTLLYVQDVCRRYPEFSEFNQLLKALKVIE